MILARGRRLRLHARRGQPFHPDFLTSHFSVMAKHAGVPVIRLHDLRHTHATLGLEAGVPPKVMADRLGHSTVVLTLDTYSHVVPALDAQAAELIAGLLDPHRQLHAQGEPLGNHGPRNHSQEGDQNDETAVQSRWGGWDSNPRPRDYESPALTG